MLWCWNDRDTFAAMLLFPHAKINLGLNVVRRRADGYHDLQSVMIPIPLFDALEAVVAPEVPTGEVDYVRTGLPIPGDAMQDLCMKAVEAVGKLRPLPGLRVHLHKVIPMGAGLGGGSSDGTHMLLLLNTLLDLELSASELHGMATALGSDCPFFLHNCPQLAEGRGEILRPIALAPNDLWLVVVNPGAHVSTPEVFRNTIATGIEVDPVSVLLERPMEEWDTLLPNALEPYVLRTYPSVAHAKETLLKAGAAYCAMSGSGSTVFAFFRNQPPTLTWPPGHAQWMFPPRALSASGNKN